MKHITVLFVIGMFACTNHAYINEIESMMELEKSDDPAVERKIDSIVTLMTLEEKAGQMLHLTNMDTSKIIECAEKYGIGFMINDEAWSPSRWVAYMNHIRDLYARHCRLNIPFVFATDHQHGTGFLDDGTVFPHNINLAATFDTVHAHNTAWVTSYETASLGHNFNYVPVMGIGRNPCWPRFYETFGESCLVCSLMGGAIVRGTQNNEEVSPYEVAACAKHFIGYSDPKSGFDRTPASIPDQELYEFFVPSFQACINAGVRIIEINSGEVNGIPLHASHDLLTGLLRGKMKFRGVVNSDWDDVEKLVTHHRVAENFKEATFLAIKAGIDCALTADCLYARCACELAREGRIPEKRLDLSVRRILRLKYELGLFDEDYRLVPKPENVRAPESVDKAVEAAHQSLVLLRNKDNILPLDPRDRSSIVVAGPNADSEMVLSGGWTIEWIPSDDSDFPAHIETVFEAIRKEFPGSRVTLKKKITGENLNYADVIVYVAGEMPYSEFRGNIIDMSLPDEQSGEIEYAVSTGKPVIVIMNAGRPRIIGSLCDDLAAFVWAGLPGYEGGTAIAELLSGKFNPSGRLPFAYPYGISHIIPYNHKNSEAMQTADRNVRWCMADFGDGLSYTSFKYSSISLSDSVIRNIDQEIKAEIRITNTGNRDGLETVLFFITDEVGTFTRPVRELKHFQKIFLQKGESKNVIFTIVPEEHLAYPDEEGNQLLEDGYFTLSVADQKQRFRYLQQAVWKY